MDNYKALMIGEKAPAFQANSTYGVISFPEDYKGRWVVLFSHPGDFTPVCTTEIMTFADLAGEFTAVNCALLGLSVDSNPSHIEWVRSIENYQWKNMKNVKVNFPIVADDFGMVSRLYGMLMPASSTTKTVRTVFVIDPLGTVRAILAYPLTTGRNINEILRLVLALQAFDATGNPTPANWMPGEDQVLPPPQTVTEAQKRPESTRAMGGYCLDWYLCFEKSAQQKTQPAPVPAAPVTPEKPEKQKSPDETAQRAEMHNIPAVQPPAAPESKMQPPAPKKKVFTPTELQKYNGSMGMPAYGAINGIVYDLSSIIRMPSHAELKAGEDLSQEFNSCHMGMTYILSKLPVVGVYAAAVSPASNLSSGNAGDYMIMRDYPNR